MPEAAEQPPFMLLDGFPPPAGGAYCIRMDLQQSN